MSVLASAAETPGPSDNAADYRQKLLTHAHTILQLGYGRLKTSTLSKSEEEDITGVLAEAMNAVLASPDSPPWRTYYAVHEEPRVWNKRRRGKRRLRLDIQVEYTGGRRPRFSFEAKRLRNTDAKSISKYFGKEGLGCFVTGNYASESDEAGMLAYIQSQDVPHWSMAIGVGLKKRAKQCEWITQHGWISVQVAEGLDTTFVSRHERSCLNRNIIVYHTLLSFLLATSG